jgi:uncharacterized paraquat-inducible protein A
VEALSRSAKITKGEKWNLLRLGLEFYCGLAAIEILLLILVLFPFVSIGVAIVFLQATVLPGVLFSDGMTILATLGGVAVFLIVASIILSIVIPSYALAFATIYRTFEPK